MENILEVLDARKTEHEENCSMIKNELQVMTGEEVMARILDAQIDPAVYEEYNSRCSERFCSCKPLAEQLRKIADEILCRNIGKTAWKYPCDCNPCKVKARLLALVAKIEGKKG
jgi:hypothetical protein